MTATGAGTANYVITDLGTLGGSYSRGSGINAAGQMTGLSSTGGNAASHAFVCSNGAMTDLNSVIDPASGWTLIDADAINDGGQINGYGNINGRTQPSCSPRSPPPPSPSPPPGR